MRCARKGMKSEEKWKHYLELKKLKREVEKGIRIRESLEGKIERK